MDIPNPTYYNYSKIGAPEDGKVLVFLRKDVHNSIYKEGKNPLSLKTFGLLLGSKIKKEEEFILHIDGIYSLGRLRQGKEPRAITSEKWDKVQNRVHNYFPGKEILGWYGLRKGWSAMLMEEDQRIHRDFFTRSWHVIYLLDSQDETNSLFYWEGDRLKRSKGHYMYWNRDDVADQTLLDSSKKGVSLRKGILSIGILGLAIFFIVLGKLNGWLDPPSSTSISLKDNTQLSGEKAEIIDEKSAENLLKELLDKKNSQGEKQSGEKDHQKQNTGGKSIDDSKETQEPDVNEMDIKDLEKRVAQLEDELKEKDRIIESLEKEPGFQDIDSNRSLYLIERGDNLYTISQKFYGTDKYWEVLANINRIEDQRNLKIGTPIILPSKEEAEFLLR